MTQTILNGVFREIRGETFGFLKEEMVCDCCGFETRCVNGKVFHKTGSIVCRHCFFQEGP